MYPSIFRQKFAVTLREMPQYIQDQVDERRANRAAAALSAASAAAADEKEDAQSGAAAYTAKRKKKPAAQPQATWQQKQNRSGQGRRSAAGVVGSRDHRAAAVAATQTMTQMCGSPRIRSSTSRSTTRRRRSASASASASTSTSASATAAAARSRGVHARAPSHNENVEQFVEYVLCDRDTADVFLRRFKFNINDAVHAYLTQTDEVRFPSLLFLLDL